SAPRRCAVDVVCEGLGDGCRVRFVERQVPTTNELDVLLDQAHASNRPTSSPTCGLPLWPASCMSGGTAESEATFPQPSRSQSKIAQIRSSSFGSRNTVEPFDPCSLRFSAPLVPYTFTN